jgi:Thioesterase superfamily
MQSRSALSAAPRVVEKSRESEIAIRYDDLTQHGHLKLTALPLVLGQVCMGQIWARHPLFETRKQGVAAILSRLVLESEPIAVSFAAPLEGRGQLDLAHERDDAGAVSALFLNTHGELWGLPSRRNANVSASTRQRVLVGRAFGEHIFTKPFGPPSERKVLSFAVPGQPSVPSASHARRRVAETASLPAGARALDAGFSADETRWTFGLTHTDVNQHVNSLVYARLFEEAALRCAARHGRNRNLLASRIELNYRKPCFAGEALVCMVQGYEVNGEPGAVGYLAPEGTPPERANCSFQLQFRSVLG